MKRFYAAAVAVLLILFMVFPSYSTAAESVTQSLESFRDRASVGFVLTISWTAASNGSLTSTAIDSAKTADLKGSSLCFIVINPGSPAPTDNYAITLLDQDGIDITGGVLATLDEATSSQAVPKLDATNSIYGCRPFNGTATFTLTGNSVDGAKGIARFFFTQ